MLRSLALSAVHLVGRAFMNAIWRWSPHRDLHAIRTAVFGDPQLAAASFGRIDSALTLIEHCDPAAFARIRAHVRGILAFGIEHHRVAYWENSAGLCVITTRYLEAPDTTLEDLALTLVHESMHARLFALGARYDDGRRAHAEVICAMAELAFAHRLRDAAPYVERVERRLSRWASAGETEWSRETMRADQLAELRGAGLPTWLISLVNRAERFLRGRAA